MRANVDVLLNLGHRAVLRVDNATSPRAHLVTHTLIRDRQNAFHLERIIQTVEREERGLDVRIRVFYVWISH